MCGICAAISNAEGISRDLFQGARALSHRGPQAFKLATFNNGFHSKNGKGFAAEGVDENDLKRLEGRMGLAFDRYATTGSGDVRETQPLDVDMPLGISLVENGNVINYQQINRELEKEAWHFNTASDGETLLKFFANSLWNSEAHSKDSLEAVINDSFNAVRQMFDTFQGDYSVIIMIAGKGLLGIRSPRGTRPLVWGKREDGEDKRYAFASESVAFNREWMDYELIGDVAPGEAIFITEGDLRVHQRQLSNQPHLFDPFEFVYFASPASVMEGLSVYEVRENLGRELGTLVRQAYEREGKDVRNEIDIVIPIPDTSLEAAQALAVSLGLRYGRALIRDRNAPRNFLLATQKERDRRIREKYNVVPHLIRGKRILSTDDSNVRGTTAGFINNEIFRSWYGASSVHSSFTFPPVTHPCFSGIDFSSRGEIIAASRNLEEIRESIGADRLTYQSVEGLRRALNGLPICVGCTIGQYGFDISAADEFSRQRQDGLRQAALAGR